MQEAIKFNASGRIIIYTNNSPIFQSKNTILPAAKELMVKAIIGNPLATVDEIALYNGAVQVATSPTTVKTVVGTDEVHFEATFSAISYQGTYTAVRLLSTNLGAIAEVTGLAINKGNEILLVTWNIKIN